MKRLRLELQGVADLPAEIETDLDKLDVPAGFLSYA